MKLFVHKILHFLMEKFPDPFHHNYNSGSRLKGVIAALIHTCVGQVKFRIANHRDSELKGSFETSRNVKLGKSLLVVANGPSSRILTQQALREINSESIDIMGVNDSILLRLNVPYQYHVLSDWVSFYETWTLINQEIRNGKSKPLAKLFLHPRLGTISIDSLYAEKATVYTLLMPESLYTARISTLGNYPVILR